MHPNKFIGQTWEEEVQWLKDWIAARLAWIDSQDFPKPVLTAVPASSIQEQGSSLPPLLSVRSVISVATSSPPDSRPSTQDPRLAMTCQVGSILYTTNNTDPRLPGGHASSNAIHYTSPIPINPGLTVKARVLSDYGLWSAQAIYP